MRKGQNQRAEIPEWFRGPFRKLLSNYRVSSVPSSLEEDWYLDIAEMGITATEWEQAVERARRDRNIKHFPTWGEMLEMLPRRSKPVALDAVDKSVSCIWGPEGAYDGNPQAFARRSPEDRRRMADYVLRSVPFEKLSDAQIHLATLIDPTAWPAYRDSQQGQQGAA